MTRFLPAAIIAAVSAPQDARLTDTRRLALALFFLSGGLGLVYEVVWMRQMLLLVGASTPAVSIVLAVFMGGLALGGLVFGGVSDRSASPLKLYGLLEAGIGTYALAMPALLEWVTPAYVGLARGLGADPFLLGLLRVATGFALLGLPAVLMGGTLPALLRVVARAPSRLGIDLGQLYTANLLGAVVGTLAAAFILIAALGIRGTLAFAALGNLIIALVAFFWQPSSHAEPTTAPAPEVPLASPAAPEDTDGRLPAALLLATIFLSGFFTMGYEVLWSRILVFAFLSTVYAFAVILATFLLGLMLGSAVFTFAERRRRLGVETLCVVQVAGALFALGLAPLGARVDGLVEAVSGGLGFTGGIFILTMVIASTLLMLIPASLMGVVFPLASRLLITDVARSGKTLGRAYWINTAGSVAGAILTGFVLIPAAGLKGSLMVLAAVQVLAGWTVLLWTKASPSRRRIAAALSASGLALAFVLVSQTLSGPTPFDPTPAELVIAHHDDATASVSVSVIPSGGRSLHIDGFEAAAADDRAGYMAMMGHVPMLLHPKPERALVICFGTGTTAGSVLQHPGVRLDIVDINRTVFDFADHFRDYNHGVARDPRTRLIVEDGRGFLQTSTETYDVITSEPMPPTFAGVASLYSREYYQLARARLKPGGLVVQWLPFHIVTPAQAWSILRSVHDVFPETTLWIHKGTGIIVARRDQPVTVDLVELPRRFEAVGAELRRFGTPTLNAFVGMYALGPSGVAALTQKAAPVTDDRPTLEYDGPRHRSARFLGLHTEDAVRGLAAVYSLRAQDAVPLTGVPPADLPLIAARRAVETHSAFGDMYLAAGIPQSAREEYRKGLSLATHVDQRAMLVFALAQVARDEGNTPEARRLADEAHALAPGNPAVVRLREALAAGTPATP